MNSYKMKPLFKWYNRYAWVNTSLTL
jgi:hypothetical protein